MRDHSLVYLLIVSVPATMIQLSASAMHLAIARFPPVRLAYESQMVFAETINASYDVCFAIPKGNRRFFMWLSAVEGTRVVSFLEPTSAHKIRSVFQVPLPVSQTPVSQTGKGRVPGTRSEEKDTDPDMWSGTGTVVSGYLVDSAEDRSLFVVDDIHLFSSTMYGAVPPIQKTGALLRFFEQYTCPQNPLLWLPDMPTVILCRFHGFDAGTCESETTLAQIRTMSDPGYPVKCMQFRASAVVAPYANAYTLTPPSFSRVTENSMRIFHSVVSDLVPRQSRTFKPAYANPRTVFLVQVDEMVDLYRLYCVPNEENKLRWLAAATVEGAPEKMPGFYQYALVPGYQSSVYLNLLFRDVRSNENLDYLEESDGEEEGENNCAKTPGNPQLRRKLLMECCYDWGRRRWIPHTLVGNDQVDRLVFEGEL